MLKSLALVLALSSFSAAKKAPPAPPPPPPAPGPDYITELGVKVFDPAHKSFSEEIDTWVLMTVLKAPAEDRRAIFEVAESLVLVIHPGPYITEEVFPCGVAPPGKILLGCTDPFDLVINIAWEECFQPHPSAGIMAHELGHAVGHLGHTDERWFGPDQDRMARAVHEPICRMRG